MQRTIDANLNRTNEGLRVLEDIARFLLNDATLSAKLKSLRHELGASSPPERTRLLTARDPGQDVGAFAEAEGEDQRQDALGIIAANARRVEESLRVLEECGKLPDSALESGPFKKARFALYQVERELTGKLLRHDKRISGLYVILDPAMAGGRDLAEIASAVIRGGATAVQLRDKSPQRADVLCRANKLSTLCSQAGARFIVNDYLDVAIASNADGLHVGPDDLPVSTARQLLPIDGVVGRSARTLETALQAQEDGADYVAVGSIYPTPSKTDTEIVGLDRLRRVSEAVSIPVVAIGGITADNVSQVVAAGADAVAVIGAVMAADDVEQAARRIAERMEVK